MGRNAEEQAALEQRYTPLTLHPLTLITDGYPLMEIEQMLGLALRRAGFTRLPRKAPIGGLAYKVRAKAKNAS